MRTSSLRLAVPALLLLSVAGCQQEKAPDSEMIATWRDGSLSQTDIQDALARLPANRRPRISDGSITTEWMKNFVEELIVDRLLATSGTQAQDGVPGLQAAMDEAARELVWAEFLQRVETPTTPTDDEVAAAYSRWRAEEYRPERRLLRYIFLRHMEGDSRDKTLERAQQLVKLAEAGARFADLAREHSNSSSRHSGGSLGELAASDLPAEVSRVAFAPPEFAVSDPLVNRDGAHIFYVEAVRPAIDGEMPEVASLVRHWLQEQRLREAVASEVRDLPRPAVPIRVVSSNDLADLARVRNENVAVLTRGNYSLPFGRLSEGRRVPTVEELVTSLEEMSWRERAFAHAQTEGWLEQRYVAQHLELTAQAHVGEHLRREGMRELLEQDSNRIAEYYRVHGARFSSRLELQLRRWQLPSEGQPMKETTLQVEDYFAEVGTGGVELETLSSRFGGTVDDLGWLTVEELGGPARARLLADLVTGETSPPYPSQEGLEMFQVTARRDPKRRPLEEVHGQVIEALLQEQGQDLYTEWRRRFLEGVSARTNVATLKLD